ncbi:unnamed protein product [Vitrella brassicaformis CCMP3155]|uniref:SH3 domain-containing protein n=1 Tax=Vitrella brassicaformis (strain CCMP3155) TaxID=1169540 RepID=A0A0G4FUT8_VITBC|nr:unnamed protein product [Vitrella brassicaformis CCMP3155]|eukprot:CEM18652.1 unnamed protein product [Vitrella brassicaformis CCMP3155]
MGSTLSSHSNTAFVRTWGDKQVRSLIQQWRIGGFECCMSVDLLHQLQRSLDASPAPVVPEEDIWPPAASPDDNCESPLDLSVFRTTFQTFDHDFDGLVDMFELLGYVILWSDTTWQQKGHALFQCVNFGRKDFLSHNDVAFLVGLVLRSLSKSVHLDPPYDDDRTYPFAVAKQLLATYGSPHTVSDRAGSLLVRPSVGGSVAKGPLQITALTQEAFTKAWDEDATCQQLRTFVDDNLVKPLPISVESGLAKDIRLAEYDCQENHTQLKRLSSKVDRLRSERVQRDEQQQQSYELLLTAIDSGVAKLSRSIDLQTKELHQLNESYNKTSEADLAQNPRSAKHHAQLLASIQTTIKHFKSTFYYCASLFDKVVALTYDEGSKEREDLSITVDLRSSDLPSPRDDPTLSQTLALLKQQTDTLASLQQSLAKQPTDVLVPLPSPKEQPRKAKAAQRPARGNVLPVISLPGRAGKRDERDTPVDEEGRAWEGEGGGEGRGDEQRKERWVMVRAAFDPPAEYGPNMLKLKAGQYIYTASGGEGEESGAEGWWYGQTQGGTDGWFPSSYVKEITQPQHS